MENCNMRFYDAGSDLWFGDFNESDYFRIEEAEHYKHVLQHERIKAVDCVLCRRNDFGMRILFIEAKKSLYATRKGFRDDISAISKQFLDSLHLTCGNRLSGSKAKITFPDGFSQYFQQCGQIVFILIIKNCPKDELILIEEALSMQLRRENLIWTLKIRAYDEELATRKNILPRDK